MANVRPLFLSRASNAFASLAMTVALAVLTILAAAGKGGCRRSLSRMRLVFARMPSSSRPLLSE